MSQLRNALRLNTEATEKMDRSSRRKNFVVYGMTIDTKDLSLLGVTYRSRAGRQKTVIVETRRKFGGKPSRVNLHRERNKLLARRGEERDVEREI